MRIRLCPDPVEAHVAADLEEALAEAGAALAVEDRAAEALAADHAPVALAADREDRTMADLGDPEDRAARIGGGVADGSTVPTMAAVAALADFWE